VLSEPEANCFCDPALPFFTVRAAASTMPKSVTEDCADAVPAMAAKTANASKDFFMSIDSIDEGNTPAARQIDVHARKRHAEPRQARIRLRDAATNHPSHCLHRWHRLVRCCFEHPTWVPTQLPE
jgi:hypothetical protein